MRSVRGDREYHPRLFEGVHKIGSIPCAERQGIRTEGRSHPKRPCFRSTITLFARSAHWAEANDASPVRPRMLQTSPALPRSARIVERLSHQSML